MADEKEDQQPDVYVASAIIGSGPETGAIVSVGKIKARDLTADHVGRFVAGYDPAIGANVPAKILKVRHVNEGKAPGVSVRVRISAVPGGAPDHEEPWHVPFDHEFELVDMITY